MVLIIVNKFLYSILNSKMWVVVAVVWFRWILAKIKIKIKTKTDICSHENDSLHISRNECKKVSKNVQNCFTYNFICLIVTENRMHRAPYICDVRYVFLNYPVDVICNCIQPRCRVRAVPFQSYMGNYSIDVFWKCFLFQIVCHKVNSTIVHRKLCIIIGWKENGLNYYVFI